MILVILICILLVGGLLCWGVARNNPLMAKWLALMAVLVDFVIVISLWLQYSNSPLVGTNNWLIDYQ